MTAGRVATDHFDIFFLFFIELSIFFSIAFVQKQKTIYNILVGVSLGAAILSKWLPALIVLPVWLLIVIGSGNFKTKKIFYQFILLLMGSVLVFLPWQVYIFHAFPHEANWEASYNYKHLTQVLEGQGKPFYYYAERIRIDYGELIYLPLIWFLWKSLKELKDTKRLSISIWFLIPFLFFSFAKTKMQGYILFASPALFMMTSEFWFMFYNCKANRKIRGLLYVILFLLIALPIRYTVERVKPFENSDRNPQWVKNLKRLKDRNTTNGVLLNYDKPIEAMFYSNFTAYPNIPDSTIIAGLVSKGYRVIINDDGKIPENIKSINGIVIERFY